MPRFRGSGCAIWRVWAAPGLCRPAKPARASRPLHAVALAPMQPASPPGRRRAPDGPAHAPEETSSWHRPSGPPARDDFPEQPAVALEGDGAVGRLRVGAPAPPHLLEIVLARVQLAQGRGEQ